MEYFYAPPRAFTPLTVTITGDEFSHLTHVMRMREGDAIRVVDGKGNSYDALITSISKQSATCSITPLPGRLHEPARALTLGAGILKNPSRFDYLVEKATEIGVTRIIPLVTERTVPRHAKIERWQKLCVAAMKQSGRSVLPEVGEPETLTAFLSSTEPHPFKFIPHEKAEIPLIRSRMAGEGPAVVCIGPEGGFSDEEVARAQEAGFEPVTLGSRRLRTETAALVSCAIILQEEERPTR
ncbi:MAG TPA: RsmE family RNA methyltransferase [Bacteroidota bacterium]|nr:RsmE family RNA methyltransferase [Bacteroidota bacterium]